MQPRVLLAFCLSSLTLFGAEPYRKPQKDVMDILNAPGTPTLSVNPNHSYALSATPVRYPSIAELAQPMHRIAGMRINPRTNGLHNVVFNSKLALWKLPAGTQIPVELPPNPKLSPGRWSPDGTRFAFTNTTATGMELWIGDTATGKTHKVEGVQLNGVMAGGRRWTRRRRRRSQRFSMDAGRQEHAGVDGEGESRSGATGTADARGSSRPGKSRRRRARGDL